MTKTQKTILLAPRGFFAMLVITSRAPRLCAFRSMADYSSTDETAAAKVMEDVRVRFQRAPPVLDLGPGALTLSRQPPDTRPAHELKTLHILRWDIHRRRLSRVEVPFWLMRLSD